jgi:hypothetical protein
VLARGLGHRNARAAATRDAEGNLGVIEDCPADGFVIQFLRIGFLREQLLKGLLCHLVDLGALGIALELLRALLLAGDDTGRGDREHHNTQDQIECCLFHCLLPFPLLVSLRGNGSTLLLMSRL